MRIFSGIGEEIGKEGLSKLWEVPRGRQRVRILTLSGKGRLDGADYAAAALG
jgi:hypothetical protein